MRFRIHIYINRRQEHFVWMKRVNEKVTKAIAAVPPEAYICSNLARGFSHIHAYTRRRGPTWQLHRLLEPSVNWKIWVWLQRDWAFIEWTHRFWILNWSAPCQDLHLFKKHYLDMWCLMLMMLKFKKNVDCKSFVGLCTTFVYIALDEWMPLTMTWEFDLL